MTDEYRAVNYERSRQRNRLESRRKVQRPARRPRRIVTEPTADASSGALRRAKGYVLADGAFSKLMDTLTGGAFLAGLGLYLGASNFTIGLLAALPLLAQVAQLPAVMILRKVPDRRRVVVLASGAARLVLVAIGSMLFLAPGLVTQGMLLLLMAAIAAFAVVSTAAWNWWMRDLIPSGELGRFFALRMRATTLLGLAALVAAGVALDWFERQQREGDGFALLFALGGAFGLLGVWTLARTPHTMPAVAPARAHPVVELGRVIRGGENRHLLVALAFLSATLTIALPFTSVYLLRSLDLGFLLVTLFMATSQLAYVAALRGWGYLSDRFGNKPVLQMSLGLLILGLLGWSVPWTTTGAAVIAALFAIHFVTGFAIGGIDLAGNNILLKTAPADNTPAFLAGISLARAAMAGVATVLAGAAWQLLGRGPVFVLTPMEGVAWSVRGFHLLALVSVAAGLVAMAALRRIHEGTEQPIHEVARAMRREVHQMSSVAGIRAFVHVVSYVVEYLAVTPKKVRRRPPASPATSSPTDAP